MRWSLLAVVVVVLLVIPIQAWSGPPVGDCRDTIDNDGDGYVDYPDDPGCNDPWDLSEKSPSLACDDGEDNDGDTYIDLDDEDCFDPWHPTEYPAACNDGDDNDGDGYVDLMDLGCEDIWDDSENSPSWICDNGVDDDGDGLIDTEDPGCSFVFDPEETTSELPCDDGIDNNGNGRIDWDEPGCHGDPFNWSEDPDCNDGVDNNDDGLWDQYGFGIEHRCSWSSGDGVNGTRCDPSCGGPNVGNNGQRHDQTEESECDNDFDDDGDGFIDFDGNGNPELADPECLGNGACRREDGSGYYTPLYPTQLLRCTHIGPRKSCGLLGIEPLIALIFLKIRRNRREGHSYT